MAHKKAFFLIRRGNWLYHVLDGLVSVNGVFKRA